MKKINIFSLIAFMVILLSSFNKISNAQSTLSIRCLLSGYVDPAYNDDRMVLALNNWGMWNQADATDLIHIVLFDGNNAGNAVYKSSALLSRFGYATIDIPSFLVGQPVFIVISSRNHIKTSSAYCVELNECNTTYDFTADKLFAWGCNQVLLPNGLWGFKAGDIDQDGATGPLDYNLWDAAASAFAFGCAAAQTDLNGDGATDGSDYSIWEAANNADTYSTIPGEDDNCNTTPPCDGVNQKSSNVIKVKVDILQSANETKVNYSNFKKGNTTYSIIDLTGKTVFTNQVEGSETGTINLPVSNFPKGIYILKMDNLGKKTIQKFEIK